MAWCSSPPCRRSVAVAAGKHRPSIAGRGTLANPIVNGFLRVGDGAVVVADQAIDAVQATPSLISSSFSSSVFCGSQLKDRSKAKAAWRSAKRAANLRFEFHVISHSQARCSAAGWMGRCCCREACASRPWGANSSSVMARSRSLLRNSVQVVPLVVRSTPQCLSWIGISSSRLWSGGPGGIS